MWLLIAFIVVPLIEIALFIKVGGLIGLWPTLAIVVLTAIAGSALMRAQGAAALARIRAAFDEMRDPSRPLADGAMILFAGALLLTPGFFTDILGLLLLAPPVRARIYEQACRRLARARAEAAAREGAPPRTTVIDAEFEDVTDEPSGWTRH